MNDLRPSPLAIILAIVLPLCVAAGWLLPLAADRDSGEDERTVDQVPRLAPDAEVIVIGNSLAQFGVDTTLLSHQIAAEGPVSLIWSPGAAAPTWYAALKNGVFAQGDRPKLILVVNTMRMMLTVDVGEYKHLAELNELLTDDEPVIEAKVFNRAAMDTPWARTLARRTERRDLFVDAFKQIPYSLREEDSKGRAEEALERVFGGLNMANVHERRRMIPIVEIDSHMLSIPQASNSPSDSLMPDLIALAQEHGARIVFVRVPIPRSGRQYWPLTTLAEDKAAVELLNELGGGYIDLHDLPLPESAFVDDHHLGTDGQRLFTTELAAALAEIGAISDGPMKNAEPPRSFRPMRRRGTPPPVEHGAIRTKNCRAFIPIKEPLLGLSDSRLEFLGQGSVSPVVAYQKGVPIRSEAYPEEMKRCVGSSYHQTLGMQINAETESSPEDWTLGLSDALPLPADIPNQEDAYWVYPGTTVDLQFDPSDLGESRVGVVALNATRAEGRPTFTVHGKNVPLKKYGLRWVGISDTIRTDKTWSLELASPEDGPFLLLTMLAVRKGQDASFVVGGPEDMTSTLRFMNNQNTDVVYDNAVHVLSHDAPTSKDQEALPSIPIERLQAVSSNALINWSSERKVGVEVPNARHMAMCSPMIAWEDDAPLEQVETLDRLRRHPGGAFTTVDDQLLLKPAEGKPEDHTYQVVLKKQRWCRKHLSWIYPGDRASFEIIESGKLHGGAMAVELGAFVFGDPDVLVGLKMFQEEKVILDTEVRAGDLEAEGNLTIPLTERLPPAPKELRLEWTIPVDGPFILTHMGLLHP